jgi:tRNA (mo5U34)-methyltransferase
VKERRQRVREVDWWHTIDLGGGLVTPGRDATARKFKTLQVPSRLDGLEVLDIGAWDGFFSFEAERRGARRVLAIDSMWKNEDLPGFDQRGFLLARELLDSKVEDAAADLYEIDPAQVGTFDLVFFLGVLYHVKDPLGALEQVAALARDRLILETHVDLIGASRPMAAFYPRDELRGDQSNWWGLNPPALVEALKVVGFREVKIVFQTSLPQRLIQSARTLRAERPADRRRFREGRVVVHARK